MQIFALIQTLYQLEFCGIGHLIRSFFPCSDSVTWIVVLEQSHLSHHWSEGIYDWRDWITVNSCYVEVICLQCIKYGCPMTTEIRYWVSLGRWDRSHGSFVLPILLSCYIHHYRCYHATCIVIIQHVILWCVKFGWLNSLWPSDRRHRSGSGLALAMACCLTAPSHYLNQSWFIIKDVLWYSHESTFLT